MGNFRPNILLRRSISFFDAMRQAKPRLKGAGGAGGGNGGEVALLRFGERLWRCTEPPRNATQVTVQSGDRRFENRTAVQSLENCYFVLTRSLQRKSRSLGRISGLENSEALEVANALLPRLKLNSKR